MIWRGDIQICLAVLTIIGMSSTAYAQDVISLVLNQSNATFGGSVLWLTVEGTHIKQEIISNNCTFFNCNESGNFIMGEGKNEWKIGAIACDCSFIQINPQIGDIEYATISDDGMRIAWLVRYERKWTILITDNMGNEKNRLTSSKEILLPSWSHDCQTLAFYVGSREWYSKKGYALNVANINGKTMQPKKIVPYIKTHSLVNTRHKPPLWSPSGKYILFEGMLSGDAGASVVSVESRETQPANYGRWHKKEDIILGWTFDKKTSGKRYKIPLIWHLDDAVEELNYHFTREHSTISWKSDGEYLVFHNIVTGVGGILQTNTLKVIYEFKSGMLQVNWLENVKMERKF